MSFAVSSKKGNILQVVLDLQFVGEKMVASLARTTSDCFNVMFCCLDRIGLLGEELKREGFFVTTLNRGKGIDYTVPMKIAHLAREKNIDIIHAHHYTSFFYCALSRIFYSKPRICFTEHGRPLPDIVGYPRKFINLLLLNSLVDKITAVCEVSKKGLSKNDWFPLSRVEVIYNGVELNGKMTRAIDKSTQIALDWIGSSDMVVGFLARLDPIKAPELLIEAFALVLKDAPPDAKLLIMGKGSLRESLEQRCNKLGISRNVLFTGLIKDPNVLLPKIRVLVVTSQYEAASLSILEAISYGVPVIATNVGGNPELIQDGKTGYLVPSGSTKEFAKAIVKILKDDNLAHSLGLAARTDVEQRFSFQGMVNKYRRIYSELIMQ